MTQKDKLIISLLREDSRMSLTEMSKKAQIPVSTLYERLKKYQNTLIKKNTTLVDFSQLGFSARARVLLKVKKSELEKLREFLMGSNALNELYKVNNGYDFMAEFIFQTMKEMEAYLDMLGDKYGVEKEEVFYIVDELRREEFLSKSNLILLTHPQDL